MHVRVRSVVAVAAVTLVAGVVNAGAGATWPGPSPVYLALGDSWAAGWNADSPSESYVEQVRTQLQERWNCRRGWRQQRSSPCTHLQLVNLAQPGATTPDLIAAQLPTARRLLRARNRNRTARDDVHVVTLHVGGAEGISAAAAGCVNGVDPACISTLHTVVQAYRRDLERVLSELRVAAGPRTRIAIGTYDVAPCPPSRSPVSREIATTLLGGGDLLVDGLHDVMRAVAPKHDVHVAEVAGTLTAADWSPDCLHPDNLGHDKITNAFLAVLPSPDPAGALRADAAGFAARRTG